MNPYPFASLNHFTLPLAITTLLRTIVSAFSPARPGEIAGQSTSPADCVKSSVHSGRPFLGGRPTLPRFQQVLDGRRGVAALEDGADAGPPGGARLETGGGRRARGPPPAGGRGGPRRRGRARPPTPRAGRRGVCRRGPSGGARRPR